LDGHPRGLPASIRWLLRKLEGEQFSILHCHEYKTNLMGALAAWKIAEPRLALIATVRHTEPGLQMGLFQALDSLVLHRFDRLTVPSEGALRELKRWPALRRSQVIHHAVEEVSTIPEGATSCWSVGTGGPVISIVGRLQAVKGHRVFLESARKVLTRRPDARFWIVGDGELRAELEALTARLGLTHAVSFLGYRSDAGQAMTMSDVVVCASLYEAFPRTILEALALERPVVATATGGIPELIVHGSRPSGASRRSGCPGRGSAPPARGPRICAAACRRRPPARSPTLHIGGTGARFGFTLSEGAVMMRAPARHASIFEARDKLRCVCL
jgi:glycosyltransferase involved in cell wall biosynthesis